MPKHPSLRDFPNPFRKVQEHQESPYRQRRDKRHIGGVVFIYPPVSVSLVSAPAEESTKPGLSLINRHTYENTGTNQ
jgi:hypothetical protein